MPGGLSTDCEGEGTTLKPVFLGMDRNVEFGWPCESVIGEYSLGLTPNDRLMPLLELVTSSGGKVDTTFWDLENSHVGWRKRQVKTL